MSEEALEAKERGNAAYKKRDFATAHENYDEAIRLSPQEMVFYSNKSAVFFEEGKLDDCVAACLKALDVGSKNKDLVFKVMNRITKVKTTQGKHSESRVWWEKIAVMRQYPWVDKLIATKEDQNPEVAKQMAGLSVAPRRRPLSLAYVDKLIPLIMDDSDDTETGKLLRGLVFSTPLMSICFGKFMNSYRVLVREVSDIHIINSFDVDNPFGGPTYIKKWAAFSWIAPFIAELSVDGALCPECKPPKWVYDMIPRLSKALTFFMFWIIDWNRDPLHPCMLPFIRRQLPYLRRLLGPVDFFLELPRTPQQPRKFYEVGLVVRKFEHFSELFETKRFSASIVELKFVQPESEDFDYASCFTALLQKTTVRMPETHKMTLRLPPLNPRFPVGDMVKALCTVFSGLVSLQLNCRLNEGDEVAHYDKDRLVSDYAYLVKEMKKMPPHVFVKFYLEEHALLANEAAVIELVNPRPRGFTAITPMNHDPWNADFPGLVCKDHDYPVCHGNKLLRYELLIHC